MEPRALRRLIAAVAAATALGIGGWWLLGPSSRGSYARETRPVVPAGTRIRVEVLNASAVRGLARRATLYLRDLGFDVVRFAGDEQRRDSTLVIDRTGHAVWARIASEAFGGARIESRPDSSGFVDLTILVGATWRPPPQTLNP